MALAQSGATPAELYYLLGTRVQERERESE